MKVCGQCRKSLELSQFNRNRAARDGLDGMCRACRKLFNDKHNPKRADSKHEPCVYFIVCNHTTVKIGHTSNIKARLGQLQLSNPYELELVALFPGSRSDEKDLHARFERYRIRGEWFKLSTPIRNYLDSQRERSLT